MKYWKVRVEWSELVDDSDRFSETLHHVTEGRTHGKHALAAGKRALAEWSIDNNLVHAITVTER